MKERLRSSDEAQVFTTCEHTRELLSARSVVPTRCVDITKTMCGIANPISIPRGILRSLIASNRITLSPARSSLHGDESLLSAWCSASPHDVDYTSTHMNPTMYGLWHATEAPLAPWPLSESLICLLGSPDSGPIPVKLSRGWSKEKVLAWMSLMRKSLSLSVCQLPTLDTPMVF